MFTILLYAALAALRGDVMDAETAFTTVALLVMITRTSRAHFIFARVFSSAPKTKSMSFRAAFDAPTQHAA